MKKKNSLCVCNQWHYIFCKRIMVNKMEDGSLFIYIDATVLFSFQCLSAASPLFGVDDT